MCTVQVLITADVMRNLRRRRNVLRPNSESICRKLFCDDDPLGEETRYTSNDVLREMQTEINKQAAMRWNFDFLQGTPLPGRYQWMPVSAPTGPLADRIEEPVVAEVRIEEPVVAEVRIDEPVVAEVRTEPEESKTESTTCKQSKITDFLQSRKRSSTSLASPKLKKMRHTTDCNTSEDSPSSSVSSST